MEHWSISEGLISGIITILIATVFIYLAAKFVLDRSSIIAALLTAVVATFLSVLAAGLLSGVIDTAWVLYALAVAVWAFVAAIFFRAKWVQGAIIGLVAWLLYFLVNLAVNAIFG